jgi:SsrA-binding protein
MAKRSSSSTGDGTKLIAQNRRARYDYHLEDRYEAGIALTGTEVKALRAGKASLVQAWVKIDDRGEAWLMQAHIEEYEHGNRWNHDPTRERKLLLHKREIERLAGMVKAKGVSLIPTRMYFRDGKAKLEFAVARGKNVADKRRDVAKRDAQREIERAIKARR